MVSLFRVFKQMSSMDRISNMRQVLLSFSLFPPEWVKPNIAFEEKISKYLHTNQETDVQNLYNDWNSVGQDITRSIKKIRDEQ
jgi:hypothetical protein